VTQFDGRYTKDSKEALPYEMLLSQIVSRRLEEILGKDIFEAWSHVSQARYVIKNALFKELTGQKTALFVGNPPKSDVKDWVKAACEPGYQSLIKMASKSQWAWRWGRHHYLQRKSPIAEAPLIGGFFRDKKREVAGAPNAPMAESGLPVKYGANLRFRVKMSHPPEIYAVIDAGNSGTVGNKNAYDQASLWHAGQALRLVTEWRDARAQATSYFELERSPKP
jgi:acyl-homoserine lactone acylase PvdQ